MSGDLVQPSFVVSSPWMQLWEVMWTSLLRGKMSHDKISVDESAEGSLSRVICLFVHVSFTTSRIDEPSPGSCR